MIRITLPDGTIRETGERDMKQVYYIIAGFIAPDISGISEDGHMIAADAEGWAELACVGETYETQELPGLHIEITED